jgi:hypothetical protein
MAHGDRAAIEALIYGYAERIDAGDLAGVGGALRRAPSTAPIAAAATKGSAAVSRSA